MIDKIARQIFLFSLLFSALWLPAARAQDPVLLVDDGLAPVTSLAPGDDLRVAVQGAVPGAFYQLRLFGPDDGLIAEIAATAGDDGTIASRMLWPFGGVVGCDCPAEASATSEFQTYEEAELALADAQLRIAAFDADGAQVAEKDLPVAIGYEEEMYFSDAEGCPRSRYEPGEPAYLTFRHPDRSRPHRLLYLANSLAWPADVPLADVRGNPEWLTLPSSGGARATVPVDFSGLAWDVPYFGLVRKSDPAAAQDPFLCEGDTRIPPPPRPAESKLKGPNGGIIISMDGCLGGPSPNLEPNE